MLFTRTSHRRLLANSNLPQHVAIIMDGNGRWAKKRGLPRNYGHSKGVQALKGIIEQCRDFRIKHLSVYAFSTENWQRPKAEVDYLMDLFKKTIREDFIKLQENQIQVRFIGEKSVFDQELRQLMSEAESKVTADQAQGSLNIMINYGSRQEILQAVNQAVKNSQLLNNEEDFTKLLYTADLPDPDLLIRTSGEVRLSNFLLWQLSYSEMYFTKVLWPDFGAKEFQKALLYYIGRHRRKGGL